MFFFILFIFVAQGVSSATNWISLLFISYPGPHLARHPWWSFRGGAPSSSTGQPDRVSGRAP